MSLKKILRIGDPRLLERSASISEIESELCKMMILDLQESMMHYGGVGIAGPQIGYFYRVIVFGFKQSDRYPNEASVPFTVLINPVIEVLDSEEVLGWEGCLSIPRYRGVVPRYKYIRYKGFLPNGESIEREVSDFHARVVQHECDHLDGILYPMRMRDMSTLSYYEETIE